MSNDVSNIKYSEDIKLLSIISKFIAKYSYSNKSVKKMEKRVKIY